MKILMINSFYYNRGGDTTYTFNLTKLLESNGHKVVPFAMQHPLNFKTKYSKYFVSEINLAKELEKRTVRSGLRVASRFIYSFEARKKIEELVQKEKPDIAHLQCIHGYITPSILSILKKRDIPIVWTQHDYKLICPNSIFFSHGSVCEVCKKRKFYMSIIRQCRRDSLRASFMVCIEAYMHRFLRLYSNVDKFLCPSIFLINKLKEYGFKEDRLVYMPNFVNIEKFSPCFSPGSYILFFGKLDTYKGIMILLEAMKKNPMIKLKIAGDGDQKSVLEKFAEQQGLKNVEFTGFKSGRDLDCLIRNSAFVVFPSICYENAPFSILESFSYGKPVIGSNLGGVSELITDGEDGLVFEPGNSEDLSRKIQFLIDKPKIIIEMGKNARAKVEKRFSPTPHYKSLMQMYNKVLNKPSII